MNDPRVNQLAWGAIKEKGLCHFFCRAKTSIKSALSYKYNCARAYINARVVEC